MITTRELAFDVPVAAVRSSDGVNVNVDLVLTLGIDDPVKFAYTITTGDLDEFIHATTQEAVRLMVRGIEALSALDLGAQAAPLLRLDRRQARVVRRRGPGGRVHAGPAAGRDDRVARGPAARGDPAGRGAGELRARGAPARRPRQPDRPGAGGAHKALELEAAAEALRLAKLDERLSAYPTAARYDLETQRIKVAQQLAGNTRAVVSMGGNDLLGGLLAAQQAGVVDPPARPGNGAAPPPAPDGAAAASPEGEAEPAAARRAATRRRQSG